MRVLFFFRLTIAVALHFRVTRLDFAFVTIDEAVVFVLNLDFVDWALSFDFAMVVDDSALDHMKVDKIQANFWWLS